ncbi:HD domain-containing phosphohydrolase [Neobacillus sp. PS3-40]|uniref:HD-GYP domain-containing protein n=1 Tax=Neobacillus sp. PS3-40 TaxID=3070679 RepID=UPI0027DEB731|nr:HD domain-containing phosphohydrolase [Neobacillus sp. PS3-40]WML43042.1 HD domain-containing phosphohydrolase [Neobacillus sp. PS3-40]
MVNLYVTKKCSELISGDIVLHPVFRSDGLLFIKKFKVLTNSVIMHLKKQFPAYYPFIVVESAENLNEFLIKKIEQSNAYLVEVEKIVEIHQQFIHNHLSLKLYIEDKNTIRANVEFDTHNHKINFLESLGLELSIPIGNQLETIIDSPRILSRAETINRKLNDLLKSDNSLQALYNRVNDFHDVLLLHSINSTFITFMIGLTLELSDEEMIDLTLASLFADIGFTEFSKEDFAAYLNNGKSEKKIIDHLKKSIEILSSSAYCRKKSVIFGVYDHHEQYDGIGSPLGKKGEEIHLYGRIISIAQHYDELVGGYVKEKSIMSFEAIKELWNQRGVKIDPAIIRIFIDRTNILKVGEQIQLSNIKKGVIIGFEDYIHNPIEPIIRLEN